MTPLVLTRGEGELIPFRGITAELGMNAVVMHVEQTAAAAEERRKTIFELEITLRRVQGVLDIHVYNTRRA